MYTQPKNVAPDAKYIYVFLFREDIIQPNDLIRQTVLSEKNGEELMNWQKVSDAVPYWIGKPIGLFFEKSGDCYEFIRAIALKDI